MAPEETWQLSIGGQDVGKCQVLAHDDAGHVQVKLTWQAPDVHSKARQVMAELACAVEDLAFGVMEDCELRLESLGFSLRRQDRQWDLGPHLSGLVWQPRTSLLSFRLLVPAASGQ
jgi:hypothetical protein